MIDSLISHTLCRINLWFHIVGWLAEVGCLTRFHIIYIYVGIGRNGILSALLLTTSIGN